MKSDTNLQQITGTIGAIYELRTVTATAKKQRFMLRCSDRNYFIEAFNNHFLLEGLKVDDAVTVEINSKMYKDRPIDYLYTMVDSPVKRQKQNAKSKSKITAQQKIISEYEERQIRMKEFRKKDEILEKIKLEIYRNTLSHFQANNWSLSDQMSLLRIFCDNLDDAQLKDQPKTIKKYTDEILTANFSEIAEIILKNGNGRFQIWTKGYTPKTQ